MTAEGAGVYSGSFIPDDLGIITIAVFYHKPATVHADYSVVNGSWFGNNTLPNINLIKLDHKSWLGINENYTKIDLVTYLVPPTTGTYLFEIDVDDIATVYINKISRINIPSHGIGNFTMSLIADTKYLLEIEFIGELHEDRLSLRWNQTGSLSIIPSSSYAYPVMIDQIGIEVKEKPEEPPPTQEENEESSNEEGSEQQSEGRYDQKFYHIVIVVSSLVLARITSKNTSQSMLSLLNTYQLLILIPLLPEFLPKS